MTRDEMVRRLQEIRYQVWLGDVPHPTTPAYEELNRKMQHIMGLLDSLIQDCARSRGIGRGG